MSTKEVLELVDQLGEDLDDLQENLEPLLSQALSQTNKKLPLLDKAKIYTIVVYAIESLLFSYLKINGVAVKDHPVFVELTRVKQYFVKIQEAENGPPKPRENMSLNKEAAGRIIKHALAGNNKLDLERAEREAREKFLAKRKLKDLEATMKEKAQVVEVPTPDEQNELSEEGEIEEPVEVASIDNPKANAVSKPPAPDVTVDATAMQGKRGKRKRRQERETEDVKASKRARKMAKKEAKALAKQGKDLTVDVG